MVYSVVSKPRGSATAQQSPCTRHKHPRLALLMKLFKVCGLPMAFHTLLIQTSACGHPPPKITTGLLKEIVPYGSH